jgi:hypothetical protein
VDCVTLDREYLMDAFLHRPGHHELVYVGPGGTTVSCFGYQPATGDIAHNRRKTDRFCVQLVGTEYEVYDLETLRKGGYLHAYDYTIGLPVFVHSDPDAAIMWALMNL